MLKLLSACGLAATLVAGLAIAMTSDSDARSFSAFAGQPQNPSEDTCFTNANGVITNVCAAPARQYCVALPVDVANNTVQLRVQAASAALNISCVVQAVNPDGTTAVTTSILSPTVFGSSQTLNMGTVSVPAAGGLYACCTMAQTSQWQSVSW